LEDGKRGLFGRIPKARLGNLRERFEGFAQSADAL
jgi:hypothetical protein